MGKTRLLRVAQRGRRGERRRQEKGQGHVHGDATATATQSSVHSRNRRFFWEMALVGGRALWESERRLGEHAATGGEAGRH